ncbi:ankyrin repeat-containing domain protein [Aspergillus pseudonomiae]|nr:ankyrin repeat-containing domain protein [Aspergillus pseudonomiae]
MHTGMNVIATAFRDASRLSLLYAAKHGHETVIRLLLLQGAPVDQFSNDQRTPLSYAAAEGHEIVAKLLLEAGADPNSNDTRGLTPLSYAAFNGHEAAVKLLLEKDAGPDSRCKLARTPLSYAAEKGHDAVVKLLLEKGAEPDLNDILRRTPLSYAAEKGHETMIRLLLAYGAKASGRRYSSVRDFLEAAERIHLDQSEMDHERRTPLSYAVQEGHEAVVRLLIAHGAEPNSESAFGRSPLSDVTQEEYEGMIQTLPPFRYEALSGKNTFRLVRLSPGSEGPIECFLRDFELSSNLYGPYWSISRYPYYKALSYTWGVSNRKSWILLNGATFPVTQNLYEALQQLRSSEYRLTLWWIDLICINQNDISERCQQVSMMKDIFSMASRVVVWLGKDTPLPTQKHLHYLPSLEIEPLKVDDLMRIVSAPYWSRVWIIQEIMVAGKIVLMSGSGTTSWPTFVAQVEKFLESIDQDNVVFNPEVQCITKSNCKELVELWKRKDTQTLNLGTLVCFARDASATNPHDKIYGLLGLVNHWSGGTSCQIMAARHAQHTV